MEVPVSEYRRRLAHYHAIARAGEPVYVTEHGRPVVRVTGPSAEDVIDQLAADGSVRRARRPRPPLGDPVPYDGPPAEQQIAEDRR